MPLVGGRLDRVARTDLERPAAACLDAPEAIDHVQRLAEGVRVPRRARTGSESHDVDADAGRPFPPDDDVVPGVSDECLCWRLHSRLLRLELHGRTPWEAALPGSSPGGNHRARHHATGPTRMSDLMARRSSIAA